MRIDTVKRQRINAQLKRESRINDMKRIKSFWNKKDEE